MRFWKKLAVRFDSGEWWMYSAIVIGSISNLIFLLSTLDCVERNATCGLVVENCVKIAHHIWQRGTRGRPRLEPFYLIVPPYVERRSEDDHCGWGVRLVQGHLDIARKHTQRNFHGQLSKSLVA